MGYSHFHRCFHFNILPNNFDLYDNFFCYKIDSMFCYLVIIFRVVVIDHDNFFNTIFFHVIDINHCNNNFSYVDYVFYTLNFQYYY